MPGAESGASMGEVDLVAVRELLNVDVCVCDLAKESTCQQHEIDHTEIHAVAIRLADEIERLRRALRFYADDGNYYGLAVTPGSEPQAIFDDWGSTADAALHTDASEVLEVDGRRGARVLIEMRGAAKGGGDE